MEIMHHKSTNGFCQCQCPCPYHCQCPLVKRSLSPCSKPHIRCAANPILVVLIKDGKQEGVTLRGGNMGKGTREGGKGVGGWKGNSNIENNFSVSCSRKEAMSSNAPLILLLTSQKPVLTILADLVEEVYLDKIFACT